MIGNKKIKALKVIGEPHVQVENLREEVFLNQPGESILEIRLKPVDIQYHVFRHKVMVQGNILANIIYKGIDGFVLHQGVELHFHEGVEVPGLVAGLNVNHKKIIPVINPFAVDIQIYITELTSDFFFNAQENMVLFKVLFRFILKVSQVEQIGVSCHGSNGIFSFRGDRSVRI